LLYHIFLPTIRNPSQEHIDYPDYARTKDKIIQWVLWNSDLPSRLVTCDQLQAMRDDKENNKFIMAYFGNINHPDFNLYLLYAVEPERQEKLLFVHVEDENCAMFKGIESSP
jgi:hypothetical protein